MSCNSMSHLDCPNLSYACRPMNRSSLTRQLHRMTKQPSKNAVLAFAGNAAKFAIQGAVVYLAVTALQGQRGKDRLKEDFHAVAVRHQYSLMCR